MPRRNKREDEWRSSQEEILNLIKPSKLRYERKQRGAKKKRKRERHLGKQRRQINKGGDKE